MKAIDILERLKGKAVFTVQDVERISYCSRKYAELMIRRLEKSRRIKKVMRNAYTTKDNLFLIASNITYPSYISFWAASQLLGFTEQILNTVHVATTRPIKRINFGGNKIKFIPIRKYFFGYKKVHMLEGDIFVAENEKLLIDAFLRHKEMGNFDEIEKVFVSAEISEEKLVGYLKRTESKSLIKRVGFLLEKTKGIDISGYFKLDKNYILLNPFSKKWKHISSKWRVKYDKQGRAEEVL